MSVSEQRVGTELVAVTVAVARGRPVVLTADDGTRLPWGPLQTGTHSMQAGLRAWVERQTGHRLGYVEQLYTFADAPHDDGDARVISVSYLGLTGAQQDDPAFAGWYSYFPWEDRRADGATLAASLQQPLREWAGCGAGAAERERRTLRTIVTFGWDGRPWRPELVLQRYELLYEAALVPESAHHRPGGPSAPGMPMARDHRRILATGLARLRSMIQYRPVVFELMPQDFTLGQLQDVVEALAGQPVHKQNFRRLVLQQDLVEKTGATEVETGGRPAQLFRFRREVLDERLVAGTKLPVARTG